MRKILIPVMVAVLAWLAPHLYSLPCYVAEIDEDMVCFVDYATENEWWAEDVEGVNLYDDVGLVMFDWFTAEIYDDQIINVTNYSEKYTYEMKGAN